MAATKKSTEKILKKKLQNPPRTIYSSKGGSLDNKSSSQEKLNKQQSTKPAVCRPASVPTKVQVIFKHSVNIYDYNQKLFYF